MNVVDVVFHGVLSRKCKGKNNSSRTEDFAIPMKLIEGILNLFESVVCDDILAHEVTKFQEGSECPYDIQWDMTFDCWEIHLI